MGRLTIICALIMMAGGRDHIEILDRVANSGFSLFRVLSVSFLFTDLEPKL